MTLPLDHPVSAPRATPHAIVEITPILGKRNRLTCAFRPILAIPHLLLVGGPTVFGISMGWRIAEGPSIDWGAGTGVLGLVAGVIAVIAWFAIIFTGVYPRGLWELAALYLRWRVRAMTYMALLRDEYPPFGDGEYPAEVRLSAPAEPRNRVTTAFRVFLLIPHFIVLWLLGVVWFCTTLIAWVSILFTRRFPPALYEYGVDTLRWAIRVESYLLLLHDDYPPFSLEA